MSFDSESVPLVRVVQPKGEVMPRGIYSRKQQAAAKSEVIVKVADPRIMLFESIEKLNAAEVLPDQDAAMLMLKVFRNGKTSS